MVRACAIESLIVGIRARGRGRRAGQAERIWYLSELLVRTASVRLSRVAGPSPPAAGAYVAPVVKDAPSRLYCFFRAAVKPGTAVGYSTALSLIAMCVAPQFNDACRTRVAHITEEEGTTSHNLVSI